MQGSLLQQGLTLMVAGMGTVFVFLTLLVAALNVMSRLASFFPQDPLPGPPKGTDSGAEIAAIAVAIQRHRASRRD